MKPLMIFLKFLSSILIVTLSFLERVLSLIAGILRLIGGLLLFIGLAAICFELYEHGFHWNSSIWIPLLVAFIGFVLQNTANLLPGIVGAVKETITCFVLDRKPVKEITTQHREPDSQKS